ncbi:hypothetical protein KP509_10G040500 [Ceratopteris richardii]|uniref:DOG1 domain-containing protein n=1 Tax=Ceratopteris richardii TaxID=49495 RepID=A0A8T2U0K7_CERRI|nr:hypothetical protein KP509_10G040500 [Ceratopteris richardii]
MKGSFRSSRDTWWNLWQQYVDRLRDVMKSNSAETEYEKIIIDCLDAYKRHLHVATSDEALTILAGDECTLIQNAFMWMGRWRPSSAIVFVLSRMGFDSVQATKDHCEAAVACSSSSSTVKEKQLTCLRALQKEAFQAEARISDEVAAVQMLLADQDALDILHGRNSESDGYDDLIHLRQLLHVKLGELKVLLQKADELRLHTLTNLLTIISSRQAASCLIGAFELMFVIRSLGDSI